MKLTHGSASHGTAHRTPRVHLGIGRARGSILVNTAIALSLVVITLIGTELGYLFYLKREFQKTADLAALAGVQAITPDACTSAAAAAMANATQNLPAGFQLDAADITCGRWDPGNFPAPTHFAAGSLPLNAVRISIQRAPPLLLPYIPGNQSRSIAVQAVATKADPSAVFSVGSRLLRVGTDSTLGALLKSIGLDLEGTTVASYEGLANVSITPGGLLCKLNTCADANITVGGLNDLLDAQVTLGAVLDAIVKAAGRSDLVAVNAALVSALKAKLNVTDLDLRLGSTGSPAGLFSHITTLTANSALDANINVLDLIKTAVGVAANGHAVDIPSLNVSLLGLLSVTSKVGIVEAPSIGIGIRGVTAYTAQVRTFLQVRTEGLIAALLKLNLPIVLDLIAAKGTLTGLCTQDLRSSTGQQRASINVEGAIVNGCIGRIANASGSQDCSLAPTDPKHKACFDQLLFSKKDACTAFLKNTELVNILGLLRADTSAPVNGLPITQPATVKLAEGETDTVGNELALGATVTNLVNTITTLLFSGTSGSGSPSPTDIANLANQIWADTGKSVPAGGAGCTADTDACRSLRLKNARDFIDSNATQSGLLTGLLNGLGDLLGAVGTLLTGDGCTFRVLGPATSNDGCVKLIKNTLEKKSNSNLSGGVSNALAVLTGLLQPILDAIGKDVLTPLLRNLLGVHLGEVDVKLQALRCNNAQLVY